MNRSESFSEFSWGSDHLSLVFYHFFVLGIDDIGNTVINEGAYSLEFENKGHFKYLSVRFWKGNDLCKVEVGRIGRVASSPSAEMSLISQLLGAMSSRPGLVCCSGCPAKVVSIRDQCRFSGKGVQYPFRFDEYSFGAMLHKKSYSVFGKIDFCSVLKFLLVRLEPALNQRWMLHSEALGKVNIQKWT